MEDEELFDDEDDGMIYDDEYPCTKCLFADGCDGWEAMFCCQLCEYTGGGDCDECNPMDI